MTLIVLAFIDTLLILASMVALFLKGARGSSDALELVKARSRLDGMKAAWEKMRGTDMNAKTIGMFTIAQVEEEKRIAELERKP